MNDKKGSRDISELKQRLGLKKAGAQPAATSAPRANGGVVPPPGMNLPPPPGVTPPQPAGPVIPNAADDPFGAMNAMAAVGTVQRAPEIVIVNDGKPVENVGGSKTAAKVAKFAIPAVVTLGLGLGIGRISKEANFYNEGLKDAKFLLGDAKTPSTVAGTKKLVADLERTLDEMAQKTKLHPDAGFDKQLADLAQKLEIKDSYVFRAKQNSMDAEVSIQILTFFAGVHEVKDLLDIHAKAAKGDDQLMAAGRAKAAANGAITEIPGLAGFPKYAVQVSAPSTSSEANATDKNAEFGAKIVEIGVLYCNGKESKSGKCAEGEEAKPGFRAEVGGIFSPGDIAQPQGDNVPTKKLVPIIKTSIAEAMLAGAEAGASEYYYVKRLTDIKNRAKKLIEEANKLETRLQAESNKSSRFSFFL